MSDLNTTLLIIQEVQTGTLLEEYHEKQSLFQTYSEYLVKRGVKKYKYPNGIPAESYDKLLHEIFELKKWLEYVETFPFFQMLEYNGYQLLAIETNKG